VQHIEADDRAHGLARALSDAVSTRVETTRLSATVASHVGLGTIGVAVLPHIRD